jgi:hypothetical protein
VKPPTSGLPMSSQYIIFEVVPTRTTCPYRVPTIVSFMTYSLARKTNPIYHVIDLFIYNDYYQFVFFIP